MPERSITFEDLKKPEDVFLLKEYLREIYRLLDPRLIELDFSATVSFDADEGEVFLLTLTNDVTGAVIKNAYQGRRITLILRQDATGGRTFAFSTTVALTGASFTMTTTANVYSVLTLIYTGSVWAEISRALDVR